MPKRSRSGLVNRPARVVAPTSVNLARSILTERAAGPSPMMRSSWKSSIAGYSTSSTAGLRRWISSMNSTSRSSRLVSSAARSPALAMTGPEVARKPTPSSRATICASVVLPRPGGPTNSTWSSASLRLRAASMKIERFLRACAWPTNSDSNCGRSAVSPTSSDTALGRDDAGGRVHSLPRLYLLGRSSPMVTTFGARPLSGTMTRALAS